MYRLFFKFVLAHMDAERAHACAVRAFRAVRATPLGRAIVRWLVGLTDACLEVHALGLTFPSPVGVAAGVDKDATWFDDLGALGFGFVEVGTITARQQVGNESPRVARLIPDRAILNKMGFPNPGAEVAAERLRRRSEKTVIGVNIGKSKLAPLDAAGDDYRAAVRQLADVSDYFVINVSSPNTPGLRELQAVELLRPLIADVRSELVGRGIAVPILIKIGPDLADDELDAVANLAVELEIDGIVAVNTTVDRQGLVHSSDPTAPFEGGGVSGPPLRARAGEVLRRLRAIVGDRLVLISVGGVETADDAWERIRVGATLVQVHTGFIYEGPAMAKRINRDLAHMVRDTGYASIQDLIGVGEAVPPPERHTVSHNGSVASGGDRRGSRPAAGRPSAEPPFPTRVA
jgi:dihydroorotate dehydrogenase